MRLTLLITILLWILIIVGISYVRADTIGGVVVDNETMKVKEGVTVDVRQCHCGAPPFGLPPIKTVKTSRYGTYEACVPAGYIYKITPVPVAGQTVIPEHGFIDIVKPCK